MIKIPKMTREQAVYDLSQIIARLSGGCHSAACCNKHEFLHFYPQQNGSLPCYCSVYQIGMEIKSIGKRLRGEDD